MKNMIGDLKLKLCPLECEQNYAGTIDQLSTHFQTVCGRFEIPCQYTDKGCQVILPRDDMATHEAECEHRPILCAHCGIVSPSVADDATHQGVCPSMPIPCPSSDQCGLIPREELAHHLEHCGHVVVPCTIHGCKAVVTRSTLEQHVQDKLAHFEWLSEYAAAQLAKIADLEAQIAFKEMLAAQELQAQADAQEAQISELEAQLALKDLARAQALQEQAAAQQAHLAQLQAEFEQKSLVDAVSFEAQLTEKDAAHAKAVEDLKNRIAELEGRMPRPPKKNIKDVASITRENVVEGIRYRMLSRGIAENYLVKPINQIVQDREKLFYDVEYMRNCHERKDEVFKMVLEELFPEHLKDRKPYWARDWTPLSMEKGKK